MKTFASVIVPTYDEEKNIVACLKSLKRGVKFLGKSCEIIVADGGSKDSTVKKARSLADKIVLEQKRTIAAGRQKGAEAASGEFLVFTDADSLFKESWLKELLSAFSDSRVSCAFGSIELKQASFLQSLFVPVFNFYLRASNALGFPSGAGANLAVRTSVFKKTGFDTSLVTGEDLDLEKKAKEFGKVVFVPRATVLVSARRLSKWGFVKFVFFHARNWMRFHLLGKPCLRNYERIR